MVALVYIITNSGLGYLSLHIIVNKLGDQEKIRNHEPKPSLQQVLQENKYLSQHLLAAIERSIKQIFKIFWGHIGK